MEMEENFKAKSKALSQIYKEIEDLYKRNSKAGEKEVLDLINEKLKAYEDLVRKQNVS